MPDTKIRTGRHRNRRLAGAVAVVAMSDGLERIMAHELVLCRATLLALAENPNVYPAGTIAHRALQAEKTLELSEIGQLLMREVDQDA